MKRLLASLETPHSIGLSPTPSAESPQAQVLRLKASKTIREPSRIQAAILGRFT